MANKKAEDPEQVASSSSSESGSDDEPKETAQQEQQDADGSPGRSRQSRNEKKARKAVLRHGMKQMPEIVKVFIRKAKQVWFVLPKPDVYKSLTSDTYVIFGRAESMAAQSHTEAAQRFTQGAMPFGAAEPGKSAAGVAAAAAAAAKGAPGDSASDADVDMTGVEPDDVELMVSQISCTKAQAVQALRKHNNDIVEAILEVTGC